MAVGVARHSRSGIYSWGSGYSVKAAYQFLMSQKFPPPAPLPFQWLWKSSCQEKHRVFFWVLLQDRLNTRGLLQRKNLFVEDYTCVMCNEGSLETRDHLFFYCRFAQACWKCLCPALDLQANVNHIEFISQLKAHLDKPFYMEIIILCAWAIWLTTNDFIFKDQEPSLYRCRAIFKVELKWLKHRMIRKSYGLFAAWVD